MNYENEDGITIETPVPGRYTITGFRAATVYVPDVGHLAPPPNIDLPMSPAIAAALRAVLDDYEPERKYPLYRMDVKTGDASVVDEEAHKEAVYLAESIWRAEFQQTAPNWSALDTTAGVISQIDNMYAGIRKQRDQARWDLNKALEGLEVIPAPQLTFQERVIKEKDELREKAEKLSDFIGNSLIFITLDPAEQERMKVQNDVMWQYVEVLDARIAAFNPLPVGEQSAPEKPRRGRQPKAVPVETPTEGGQE